MTPSSRSRALSDLASHGFAPRIGYYQLSEAEKPRRGRLIGELVPPAAVPDRSLHRLYPPQGGPGVLFLWIKDQKTWAPWPGPQQGQKVLAFTSHHLGSHGWRYGRIEAVNPPPGHFYG